MLKRLSIVSTIVCLGGCGIMPGMDNLNTMPMRRQISQERVVFHPTLIPITPTLLTDQRVTTYFYHIAPSDVLHISVWQHPEFMSMVSTGSALTPGVHGAAGQMGYLVNAKGYIYFPLVGYIKVADKTVDQVRKDISLRLERYVPNPQINVRVSDFRGQKIYVLGEVNKSGFLPINDQRLTIADALAFSGWMDPNAADPRHIYVIRGDYTNPLIYWLDARTPDRLLLAERFSLKPKDILFVSSAPATRWNRVLNQLLPTIQTIWFTKSVVNS